MMGRRGEGAGKEVRDTFQSPPWALLTPEVVEASLGVGSHCTSEGREAAGRQHYGGPEDETPEGKQILHSIILCVELSAAHHMYSSQPRNTTPKVTGLNLSVRRRCGGTCLVAIDERMHLRVVGTREHQHNVR